MRLIDADYLLGTYQALCSAISCEECRAKYKDGTCKVEHWLKAQPTIDAVEVVRCKDCVYCEQYGDRDGDRLCNHGSGLRAIENGDCFCKYGERKWKDNDR